MGSIRAPFVVLLVFLGFMVPLPAATSSDQESSVALRVMDPAQAIAIARTVIDDAKVGRDAQAARRRHLAAAAVLRSGILGLHTRRDDELITVEHLAQLYHLYVITLSDLEMRHHAVIAALAGTDQALRLIERLGQQKLPNPWKRTNADGRIAWDDSRVTPLRLATDGLIIASQLKARDPGMNVLYLATLDRLKRLDPSCGASDLKRQQILALMAEEDYEAALCEAEHLLRERPDLDLWIGTIRNVAIPAWVQRSRRERDMIRADALLAGLARDNALLLDKLRSELAQLDLPPERRQEVERTFALIQVADTDVLLARQDHDAAMPRITDLLDEPSPDDATQIARWQERLGRMLTAHERHPSSSPTELEQARLLAVLVRNALQHTTDKIGYWEASLLVLELSLLRGDHRMVDDTLAVMGRNRSDLSRDLITPPVAGDDPRVRRPLGSESVALAGRFLDLYGKAGITMHPPFRIEQVANGLAVQPLFVDRGAPAPVARMATTPDGQQVTVYVMDEGMVAPPTVP